MVCAMFMYSYLYISTLYTYTCIFNIIIFNICWILDVKSDEKCENGLFVYCIFRYFYKITI